MVDPNLDWLEEMELQQADGTTDDPSVTDDMMTSLFQETSAAGQLSLQAAQKVMDDLSKKS
jgi:hypothetical protein